jgi:hypothetical protein
MTDGEVKELIRIMDEVSDLLNNFYSAKAGSLVDQVRGILKKEARHLGIVGGPISRFRYKVGDRVRIRSKEWIDTQPKNRFRSIDHGIYCLSIDMQDYAGKDAYITRVNNLGSSYGGGFSYSLSTDDGCYNWESWMFEDKGNGKK